jgi:hypothetical protein
MRSGEGLKMLLPKIKEADVIVWASRPTCRYAKAGGGLHELYWYFNWKKDGKIQRSESFSSLLIPAYHSIVFFSIPSV